MLRLFEERLRIHEHLTNTKISSLPPHDPSIPHYESDLRAIARIKNKILDPARQSKSSFRYFYLHLFPGRMRTLQSIHIYNSDKLSPNGTIPNYMGPDISASGSSWRRRVYDS